MAGVIGLTYSVDPFGLYGERTENSLSRIDQFYHMRSSKPLTLRSRRTQALIVGSSRTARLSPDSEQLSSFYNAAIPGATPSEMRELLEYSHFLNPLKTVVIGWDFEAFLSLTPPFREGFNRELLNARNPVSVLMNSVSAHKRTLFSFTAVQQSIRALNGETSPKRPSYLPDGSWHRNSIDSIGPFGFALLSKEKVETFRSSETHRIDASEIRKTLAFCYSERIDCRIFATPVHLFHFELFYTAKLITPWRQWHKELVKQNAELARAYDSQPFPIWGFNAVRAAVSEPIAPASSLATPWYTDNLHFRPKFGAVILRTVLDEEITPEAVRLTQENVDDYLGSVLEAQKAYVKSDNRKVRRLKRSLGI